METGGNGEHIQVKNPEFNAGSFTISHLSNSSDGFEFQTADSIRRRTVGSPYPLDSEQKDRLKSGMQRELKFNNAAEVQDARSALKEALIQRVDAQTLALPEEEEAETKKNNDPNLYLARFMKATQNEDFVEGLDDDLRGLYSDFEKKRKAYTQKGKKIGIRNVHVTDNTITADVKFVSFPVYNEFSSPQNSPELLDLSSITGTAMIVRSADGRIVIQHRAIEKQRLHEEKRTRGNASYTDIPGASVAGMVDASSQSPDRQKGTPDPVDTDTVKAGIFKEAGEELGLETDDLKQVRIVGLAQDKVKIHDEILLLADSKLTSEQIREHSRTSKRNKNLGDADFEEKFVDIEASPQAIEALLTQVRCPLPPTHSAALVAAGYSLVLQEQGVEAANEWKQRLEKGVAANYQTMNDMVAGFYNKHPEALMQVPERFWGKNVPTRNLHGYTPAYGPEEQGLPSFEDEMVRTGLIPETRRSVPTAFLFDVDGVITDPTQKKVIHPEILDSIAEKIKQGMPVALNTGRSVTWLQPVISSLVERFQEDKTALKNLAVIAEFGGTWATFDDNGNMNEGKVNNIVIPDNLHDRIRALVTQKYGDSMFYDETKETMVSIEMKDGHDLADFTAKQAQLKEDLATILSETEDETTYDVHADTIATNVRREVLMSVRI